MRSMRLIAPALVVVSLLVVSLAWGQGGNPPASTKESGETSSHGMTAAEQTAKDGGVVEQQIRTLQDQGRDAALGEARRQLEQASFQATPVVAEAM